MSYIHSKESQRQFVYNDQTMAWEPMAQPSTGGTGSTAAGSTQVSLSTGNVQTVPQSTGWAKSAGLNINSSNELAITGTIAASTQVSITTGSVTVTPVSTGWAGLAGFSINSSNELLTVGASGSTQVSLGGGNSSVTITAGNSSVTIHGDSTSVIVSGNSSVTITAGNSSVTITAGNSSVTCTPAAGSTWNVRALNSSAGDFLATVSGNIGQASTAWQTQSKIQDSSGVSPNIVGTRPTTGAQGFAVRMILNDLLSTCFSTFGNNSTSNTVVSSAANLRHKVYAYSITSTAEGANQVTFNSSAGTLLWPVVMHSISSAVTGANLAVSPPAWLFATAASEPLVMKVSGTTGSYDVAFSYFSEA